MHLAIPVGSRRQLRKSIVTICSYNMFIHNRHKITKNMLVRDELYR